MVKRIIIDYHYLRTRVAVLEDDELVEYLVEAHGDERLVGNIYKGKVQNVLPGMDAAFVDIGLDKNAFLQAGDAMIDNLDLEFNGIFPTKLTPSIRKLVRPGQEIMVQVLKDANGSKGARVTTHVSVAGRSLVLMPTINHVGVSRRIENDTERARLKKIAEQIKPENMGVIMRTSAFGGSIDDFRLEIELLVKQWNDIQSKYTKAVPASAIQKSDTLLNTVVRDIMSPEFEQVIINNKSACKDLKNIFRDLAPDLLDRLSYTDLPLIFDHYQIEGKLEKLFARKIWLKNGAYIIIDKTEALTIFDVNTGKYIGDTNLSETALETNLLAAREIVRQLRLRNIGGIIIIDFIDMPNPEHKAKIIADLNSELRKDRIKSTVLGMTSLGLVEMTRKKMLREVSSVTQCTCPCCDGTGMVLNINEVLMSIRRELIRIYENSDMRNILIITGSSMFSVLNKGDFLKKEIQSILNDMMIYLKIDDSMALNSFKITKMLKEEINEIEDNAVLINA